MEDEEFGDISHLPSITIEGETKIGVHSKIIIPDTNHEILCCGEETSFWLLGVLAKIVDNEKRDMVTVRRSDLLVAYSKALNGCGTNNPIFLRILKILENKGETNE